MRAILEYCCLVLVFHAPSKLKADPLSIRLNLVKRESSDDGWTCLLSCIENMESQLGTINTVQTETNRFQQSPSSMCQRYDPQQLDELCKSHQETKKCLDQCPRGETRNAGHNALAPLNFMCLDRRDDFKKHLPCLDSMCDRTERACLPVCSEYQGSVDKVTEIQRDIKLRQSITPDALSKIVADACQYVDCYNQCSQPLLVEKCGEDGANLQLDTIRKAFSSITNLFSGSTGSNEALPESCQILVESFVNDEYNLTENTTNIATMEPVRNKWKESTSNWNESKKKESELDFELQDAFLISASGLCSIRHVWVIFAMVFVTLVVYKRQ